MSPLSELVVLVDDSGTPIGSADKATVHTQNTPLHLAFSCHIFNARGEVLVTRRALTKLTWPGVWTNSVCGHPAPEESIEDALARRARHELGINVQHVTPLLPDFRYRAVDASGVVENEICPVFTAVTSDDVSPRADEIAEFAWVDPAEFQAAVTATPFAFSPWSGWQLAQVSERQLPYTAPKV